MLFKLFEFEFPAKFEFGGLVADLGKVLGVLGLKIILELGLRLMTSPLFREFSRSGNEIFIFLNLGAKRASLL